MVIPLIHHKNSDLAELKVIGGYPFVYRIFSRCAKGIVIYYNYTKRLTPARASACGYTYFLQDMMISQMISTCSAVRSA